MAKKLINGTVYEVVEGLHCDSEGKTYRILQGYNNHTDSSNDNKICYSLVATYLCYGKYNSNDGTTTSNWKYRWQIDSIHKEPGYFAEASFVSNSYIELHFNEALNPTSSDPMPSNASIYNIELNILANERDGRNWNTTITVPTKCTVTLKGQVYTLWDGVTTTAPSVKLTIDGTNVTKSDLENMTVKFEYSRVKEDGSSIQFLTMIGHSLTIRYITPL